MRKWQVRIIAHLNRWLQGRKDGFLTSLCFSGRHTLAKQQLSLGEIQVIILGVWEDTTWVCYKWKLSEKEKELRHKGCFSLPENWNPANQNVISNSIQWCPASLQSCFLFQSCIGFPVTAGIRVVLCVWYLQFPEEASFLSSPLKLSICSSLFGQCWSSSPSCCFPLNVHALWWSCAESL